MARPGAIIAMERCLEQVAGKSVAARVMEGSELITEKVDKRKIAQWAKGAMERLDASLDEGSRVGVMVECGYNCTRKNHRLIDRAVARRRKYAELEDFLEAEQKKPMMDQAGLELATALTNFLPASILSLKIVNPLFL